uniref:RRM domain-containing protein n=1 Tax=Trichobilharzia regenti TaxID=157069 RepID=A0AA85IVJ0_TRIRE|nr:unnamed protein product [Trichobilharzia regenti]
MEAEIGPTVVKEVLKVATSLNLWIRKVTEIVVYSRCLVVQFDSDIEAAGAVQCENGALLFGTKVSVKHMEASDLKALRRAGPPIDRFPSHSQRHSGSTSDRDRDKERGRISSRRDQFRDRSRTPDTKRPRDVSPRRHSRSPVKSRNDRRTVHPLNWLSEVAERDNKLNGSSLLGSAAVPIEKPVVKSPPYLVAIITVQHYLVPYAEIIEQRITKTLNPSGGPPITHIVVLLSADHLQPCLADLTKDGVPFAITCTMPNKSHNSCSLRILYTPTQHEHRNMPLDGAMSLLHREYTAYMTKITSEEKTDPPEDANFLPPSRHLASLLRMLADSRVLSIGELDEISAFVLERKRRLEGHQTAVASNENTAELKSRILSMLYPQPATSTAPAVTSSAVSANITPQTSTITTTSIGNKLAENLSNPVVQKAIDTLMSYPTNSASCDSNQKTSGTTDIQGVPSKNTLRNNMKMQSSTATGPYPPNMKQNSWTYEDGSSYRSGRPLMPNEFDQSIPYGQHTRPNAAYMSHEYPGEESRKGPGFTDSRGLRGAYSSEYEIQGKVPESNGECAEETYPGWPRQRRNKRGGKVAPADSYQYLDPKNYAHQSVDQPTQQPADLMSTEVYPLGNVAEAYNYSQAPSLLGPGVRGRSQRMTGGNSAYNNYNYQAFGPQQPNSMNPYQQQQQQSYGYTNPSSFY